MYLHQTGYNQYVVQLALQFNLTVEPNSVRRKPNPFRIVYVFHNPTEPKLEYPSEVDGHAKAQVKFNRFLPIFFRDKAQKADRKHQSDLN